MWWRTAGTCADDLFTATAWQRWADGAAGLSLSLVEGGFAAPGAIDAEAWRNGPAHLLTARAGVTVVGGGGDLFLAFPAAGAGGQISRRPPTEHAMLDGSGPVDLSALMLER